MTALFNPTINIFKNGIVINYKKVGSRFMESIASGEDIATKPSTIYTNNTLDFSMFSDYQGGDDTFLTTLNYKLSNRLVYAPWHWDVLYAQHGDATSQTTRWKNDLEFFKDQNVNSYNDFFLKNNRDIIFVIRDPLLRFFSGLYQNVQTYLVALSDDNDEVELLKKRTNLSPEAISKLIYIFLNTDCDPTELVKTVEDELVEIYKYFLTYKWDLIAQDVHSEPYLIHFREMMYNIEDHSKIKVIDLAQLKSKSACEFFCKLRGDDVIRPMYDNIDNTVNRVSNVPVYSKILNDYYRTGKLVQRSFGRDFSLIDDYLKYELVIYNDLINSPYFINLAD